VHKLRRAGQIVDTSLMEAALAQTYWQAAIYFATGGSPGPRVAHVLTGTYRRSRSRWVDQQSAAPIRPTGSAFAEVLGHPSGATIRGVRDQFGPDG